MSEVPKLDTPILRVVLDDGADFEVQIDNRDLIHFDKTRLKHRWPAPGDAPSFWATFIAWSHLRREGLIPADLSWEVFSEERCLLAKALDEEEKEPGGEDEEGPGSPTLPGPGPG